MSEKKKSVYASIADDIIEKIKSGTYAVGSLLPPEREFMSIYSVQRTTVRRGLDILSLEGYIKKVAGLGSVVNSKVPVKVSSHEVIMSEETSIPPANDCAILLPSKNLDSLPEFAVDTIASLNKYISFMTSDDKDVSKNTNLAAIDTNPDSKKDVCLVLCQDDDRRSVTLDNDKSLYVALTYLENLGHTKIAYIGTDKGLSFENAVYDSFCTVNSFLDEELISLEAHDEKSGFDAFSELFRRHGKKFTAVCAVNDRVAKGILKAAKYYKINVPEELSVFSLCSSGKEKIDAIVYDTDALADEIIYSVKNASRIATVLFGGKLTVHGTCAATTSFADGEKNISNFLL